MNFDATIGILFHEDCVRTGCVVKLLLCKLIVINIMMWGFLLAVCDMMATFLGNINPQKN
jgi:hypothetical protein